MLLLLYLSTLQRRRALFNKTKMRKSQILSLSSILLTSTGNLSATLVAGMVPDPNNPLLAGWWDASNAQGQIVTGTWPDQSQYGRDANAIGSAPRLVDTGDGLSSVAFERSNGFYTFPRIPLLDSPDSSASIFIVTSLDREPPSFSPVFALGDLDQGGASLLGTSVFLEAAFQNGAGQTSYNIGGTPYISGTRTISFMGFDGDTLGQISDFRINGHPLNPTITGGPLSSGPIPYAISALGGSRFGSWEGEISEVLVFQEKLSPQQEFEITSYLSSKYGIAVVPEPSTSTLIMLAFLGLAARRRA